MRAQITVFIILGVLILAAFAIVIFVASNLYSAPQPVVVDSQQLMEYVDSCLETVSKEGLILLGRQGGYLYESQGGLTPDGNVSYLLYSGAKVAYDVFPPKGDFASFYADPPMYPFDKFPYVNNVVTLIGFYGMNNLPPLFKITPQGKSVRGSIQGSLESYISRGLDSCVNWAKFSGIKVTSHPKTVSVILAANATHFASERFFTVSINWPLNFSYFSGEKLNLNAFAVKVPVRLATVYFGVNDVINKDISDISYEPSSSYFDVSIEKVNKDSVVKISDPQSVLGGSPYEFWFARRNRAPALWYIDAGVSTVFTGTKVSVKKGVLTVNDVCDGKKYDYALTGSDPDNDAVTFSVDASGFANAPGPSSFTVYAKDGGLVDDYQVLHFDVVQCP